MCELQLLVVTDFGVSRKHKGVMKMNKYQEALDRLISNIGVARCNYRKSGEAKENVRTLQELIDKATPKKPSFDKSWEDEETTDIYNEDGSINENVCECPNCHKHSIYDSEYGVRFNHCHECGQALDWSDEE